MLLDLRLDFQEHWKSLLKKVNKTVALLRKFQNILPRSALLTIYKCFVRTYLDYGDIIYDQAFNNSFHQKIESLQYNAGLAITGAIRGTSREIIYQELGLASLHQRRWHEKLCFFFKVYKNQCPKYLFGIIPQSITRLRLGLSHLREHKFKLNPLYSCGKEVETTFRFPLSCPNYSDERLTLLSKIRNINPNILENTNSQITRFFLYGDTNFTALTNFIILSSTIAYILATKRFDEPLFH